jgi:hypothetical protein
MTQGYLAFKLRDGRIKGTGCRWDAYPQGFGRMIVEFLRMAQPDKNYPRLAQRMDTIKVSPSREDQLKHRSGSRGKMKPQSESIWITFGSASVETPPCRHGPHQRPPWT